MNKYFFYAMCLSLFTLASCNNEIDINADYEEIAVVYGLMDPSLDTQWVRIERGYLGTSPAPESFDQPDSIYYQNLTVELLEFDESGAETRRTILVEDATSRQLDSGLFTSEGFKLYRTEPPFNVVRGSTYQIIIDRNDGSEPVRSDLDDTKATIIASGTENEAFSITQPVQLIGSPVAPNFNGRFEWDENTGYKAAGTYGFYYDEIDINTKVKTLKFFEVTLSPTLGTSTSLRFTTLYQAIAARVPINDQVIRFFRKMTFRVTAINRELDTYQSLNVPTTGIVQSRPEYTNIINGIGIFSGRATARQDSVVLSSANEDLLALSDIVCELRFALQRDGDTVICNFVDGGTNGTTLIEL